MRSIHSPVWIQEINTCCIWLGEIVGRSSVWSGLLSFCRQALARKCYVFRAMLKILFFSVWKTSRPILRISTAKVPIESFLSYLPSLESRHPDKSDVKNILKYIQVYAGIYWIYYHILVYTSIYQYNNSYTDIYCHWRLLHFACRGTFSWCLCIIPSIAWHNVRSKLKKITK